MGTLKEDSESTKNAGNIRLWLENITADKDPENILPLFQSAGVIVHLVPEQVKNLPTDSNLKKGTRLKLTLSGLPIMTMSISPQIPGRSVAFVEPASEETLMNHLEKK
ncbi:hypothetical protein [Candidatus Enterococcus leclercqii]|uniref:hypothetical protein n=1 Tax=Candidatus Enterococcus leclercqii TaxID=1857218 RepID=UPI00137AA09E|nr:hypothetical protein [Enterococcus sp. CU9D]KAF1292138.1 hypothetical protein BAU14_06290 [Enterococcus sp. CU9D]